MPSAIRIRRFVSRRHGRPDSMRSMVRVERPARRASSALLISSASRKRWTLLVRTAPPTCRPARDFAWVAGTIGVRFWRLEPAARPQLRIGVCRGSHGGRGPAHAPGVRRLTPRGGPADRDRPGGEGLADRILVVDDDEALRESLGLLLAAEGYDVVTAHDAASALARLEEPVEVVLCDVRMPGMDGLELLPELIRRLRSEEHTSELQSLRHLVCR